MHIKKQQKAIKKNGKPTGENTANMSDNLHLKSLL